VSGELGEMGKTIVAVALAAMVMSADGAMAAPTPGQRCEGGKHDTAGKYLACLGKAERILALTGAVDLYDAALPKCQGKLLAGWQKLEASAAAADAACPSTGDAAAVQTYLDGCIAGLSSGVSGGTLPSDVVTCNADLATCNAGFGACTTGLGACQSDCVAGLRPPLRTGQTTPYGAGSDGNLQPGAARSFTDNGDGTVTDNTTGLMWEKKDDSGGVHDKDNVYRWSIGTNELDGTVVTVFLAALNGGSGLAGHTDWRLPSLSELESLRSLEAMNPATYSAFSNACVAPCGVSACSCTRWDYYWSSSTSKAYASNAWVVNFSGGSTGSGAKTDFYAARAVRPGF